HPFPRTPAEWDALLRERLGRAGSAAPVFRIVRAERARAIVEVDHRSARDVRAAFDSAPRADAPHLRSVRTWGTLVGAKAWLRDGNPASPSG
ncbi:MAG TPA: hypothetical protein VML53_06220, partial [Thermoplasmata archaeon]|nr:hypothetical protein [Thermoplasmata archaeon]